MAAYVLKLLPSTNPVALNDCLVFGTFRIWAQGGRKTGRVQGITAAMSKLNIDNLKKGIVGTTDVV